MNLTSQLMTSQERLDALFSNQPTDRVPVLGSWFMWAHIAKLNGMTITDIYEFPKESIAAQKAANEMYGLDGGTVYMMTDFGSWEFGGLATFPGGDSEAMVVTERAAPTAEKAMAIKCPEDILNAGGVHKYFEAAKIQREMNDQVTFDLGTPFLLASNIIGVDNMMLMMIENPEAVHNVLEEATKFYIRLLEIWVKNFGADNLFPMMAASSESNRLISPAFHKEFSVPYLKKVLDKMIELKVDKLLLHICSEQNPNLKNYLELTYPINTIFSVGPEMDMLKMAELFPQHIIAGNIDPIHFLQGKPQEIYEECCRLIKNMQKTDTRFILMPGCDVPPNAPPVNVYQMVKASMNTVK
ncbi:MAG: uroporphyrinogen decarboxylase family protein [Bacillota bacterium]